VKIGVVFAQGLRRAPLLAAEAVLAVLVALIGAIRAVRVQLAVAGGREKGVPSAT